LYLLLANGQSYKNLSSVGCKEDFHQVYQWVPLLIPRNNTNKAR
jgi:hypothetical protein